MTLRSIRKLALAAAIAFASPSHAQNSPNPPANNNIPDAAATCAPRDYPCIQENLLLELTIATIDIRAMTTSGTACAQIARIIPLGSTPDSFTPANPIRWSNSDGFSRMFGYCNFLMRDFRHEALLKMFSDNRDTIGPELSSSDPAQRARVDRRLFELTVDKALDRVLPTLSDADRPRDRNAARVAIFALQQ